MDITVINLEQLHGHFSSFILVIMHCFSAGLVLQEISSLLDSRLELGVSGFLESGLIHIYNGSLNDLITDL